MDFIKSAKKKLFVKWLLVELILPFAVPLLIYVFVLLIDWLFPFNLKAWDVLINKVILGGTYTFYGFILTFGTFLDYLDCNYQSKSLLLILFFTYSLIAFFTGLAFVANLGLFDVDFEKLRLFTLGLILICLLFSSLSKAYIIYFKKL